MSRRRSRVEKDARRLQILRRYQRERVRNRLARPGRHPLVLVLDRLKAGYNVAKIFRSACAMGVAEIHLIDIGPFDPAPAKGGLRKVPARFHDHIDGALTGLVRRGFTLYAFAPDAEQTLPHQVLDPRCAFVFGHEEHGLSLATERYPSVIRLRIPHAGQMQSLNVSIAASIAMYEYLRQHDD